MKYTLTKRDIGLILGFLGVLILGLVYYFVYIGYSDKTKELQAANDAMQSRVDVLQDLVNRQDELIATTKKNQEEASRYMEQFPADYRYEDAILFGIELTDVSPYDALPNISFGEEESIYTFEDVASIASEQVRGYIPDGGVVAEGESAPEENSEQSASSQSMPELKRKIMSYTHITDYSGLKNSLAYVLAKKDRSGVAINVAYDPTSGMLNGVLNVVDYYVTNTDRVYIEPEMPIVMQGTDDMFGTLSLGGPRPSRLNSLVGSQIQESSISENRNSSQNSRENNNENNNNDNEEN